MPKIFKFSWHLSRTQYGRSIYGVLYHNHWYHRVKNCFSLDQHFSSKTVNIHTHEDKGCILLALSRNKNICLFLFMSTNIFSDHILENKYLSWAINALQCLIRNKTQYIFLDHTKQCFGNSTLSFVKIALNISEGNHLPTFMDENVLDMFRWWNICFHSYE
jgi:hypothetical protein